MSVLDIVAYVALGYLIGEFTVRFLEHVKHG